MSLSRTRFRFGLRTAAGLTIALLLIASGWTLRGAESKATDSKSLHDLREEKMDDIKQWYECLKVAHAAGTSPLEASRECCIAWKDAALDLAKTRQERIAILKQYRDRIKQFELLTEALFVSKQRGGEAETLWEQRYWVAQADTWIAEEEAINPVLKDQLDAAKNWYDVTKSAYDSGTTVLSEVYFSSIAWKDAALAVAANKAERIAAIKAHQQRIKTFADEIEALFQANARGGEMDKRNATIYWLAQAKTWIAAEEAKP